MKFWKCNVVVFRWSWSLDNEETLALWGLWRHGRQTKKNVVIFGAGDLIVMNLN